MKLIPKYLEGTPKLGSFRFKTYDEMLEEAKLALINATPTKSKKAQYNAEKDYYYGGKPFEIKVTGKVRLRPYFVSSRTGLFTGNSVAIPVLKGLGYIGEGFNSILANLATSNGSSTGQYSVLSPQQAAANRRIQTEVKNTLNKDVWPALMPSNYAAALLEGSLNPYRGAEIKAGWSPMQLLLTVPFDVWTSKKIGQGLGRFGQSASRRSTTVEPSSRSQYVVDQPEASRTYVSPNSETVELQLSNPIMDLHSSRVLIKGNKLRNGHLFEDILESDIPLLKEMFNSGKYTEMIVPGSGQKVKMFNLNNKLPVRYDVLEKLLQENDPALKVFETEYNNPLLTEAGKTELNKAKTKYKKIGDTYLSGLEELKEQTKRDYRSEINWDWYHGGILSLSNIPAKVATSPVYDPRFGRVVDLRPIMLRFYENVLDKDGIIQKVQKYLVDNKIIEPWEGKWLYQPKGSNSRVVVDPTRFTLNWILENELKSTNRINFAREFDRLGLTFIPYHSTPIGDLNIYRLFSNPNSRPLFASIDDGSLGFYPLKRAYQKTKFGTSIPVMRKAKPIEIETLISENGLHSSNNFGDVGELMKHFLSNGGRARQVRDVSDARNIKGNTGQRQNEYNFGTGTPDIGFLLNTFDFEYPSSIVGPFLGFKKGGKLLNHYKKK